MTVSLFITSKVTSSGQISLGLWSFQDHGAHHVWLNLNLQLLSLPCFIMTELARSDQISTLSWLACHLIPYLVNSRATPLGKPPEMCTPTKHGIITELATSNQISTLGCLARHLLVITKPPHLIKSQHSLAWPVVLL